MTVDLTPHLTLEQLAERRARLAPLTRDELVGLYLALPGRNGDETWLSKESLIDVLAYSEAAA